MATPRFRDQIAGSAEKNLPAGLQRPTVARNDGAAKHVSATEPIEIKPEARRSEPLQGPAPGNAEWQRSLPEMRAVESPRDTGSRVVDYTALMERAARTLESQFSRMKDAGANGLAVTVRPDSDTELFVQIRQQNGQWEAVIRCERGNFSDLNAHWHQLQEALAGQKLRLAPLQDATQSGMQDLASGRQNGGGQPGESQSQNFSGRRQDSHADSKEPMPQSPPPTERAPRRPAARPASAASRWETWA